MLMSQELRFDFNETNELIELLRSLSDSAVLVERDEIFSFSQIPGRLRFVATCCLDPSGLLIEASGEYLGFTGELIEMLSVKYGRVTVADA